MRKEDYIKATRFTQRFVAKKLDISEAAISRWDKLPHSRCYALWQLAAEHGVKLKLEDMMR